MKLSDLKTNGEVLAEDLRGRPDFRAEWERTALARVVANFLVRYRAEHSLSQRALADRLGWKQPQVARLELGEHNPTLETLLHIVGRLGMRMRIELAPTDDRLEAPSSTVSERAEQDGANLLVSAG